MITDSIRKHKSSAFSKLFSFMKGYIYNVFSCYEQFIVPGLLILAFSASTTSHLRDSELLGLQWLRYASEEDDMVREQSFPAYEPGTYNHKRRMRTLELEDTAKNVTL